MQWPRQELVFGFSSVERAPNRIIVAAPCSSLIHLVQLQSVDQVVGKDFFSPKNRIHSFYVSYLRSLGPHPSLQQLLEADIFQEPVVRSWKF